MSDPTADSKAPRGVLVRSVDAAEEQAWNELQLTAPVLQPAARLWRYLRPAVVLGRSQQWLQASVRPVGTPGALPVVRRASGGGAVLVGPWMLGASVVLPPTHPLLGGEQVADGYRWLGDLFVAALAEHGVQAASMPRERTRKAAEDLAWACFAGMSPWEVAVADRKLVGFAQRRSRHGVLIVAGALLDTVPWEILCAALERPGALARDLAATTIDASEILGRPLPAELLANSVGRLMAEAFA
jgi:lipoate---protein ligase